MKLALGTVQFGLDYGIAGRGEVVPEAEVREILTCARAVGIDTLDTAAAYGTIEARLGRLSEGLDFRIVSKLPPLPEGLSGVEAVSWVTDAFERARKNLCDKLVGYMFHRAEDLRSAQADVLWNTLQPRCQSSGVELGVSCYGPEDLAAVQAQFQVALAQLPANALDQRFHLASRENPPQTSVHLRSVFLQGLLLMPFDLAVKRLHGAETALRRWHDWCAERGWTPLFAALAVVKGFASASHCVIGVDSVRQLEDIAAQWAEAKPVAAPELAYLVPEVIDPRFWRLAA